MPTPDSTSADANESLELALAYAQRGWRVVPVSPGKNHPSKTGWPELATTDPDQIRRWWPTPDLGVSIATGPGSAIFVLDIDEGTHADGTPKCGLDSLAELEQRHGPLPDTYTVVTPSGGEHRYFAYPQIPDGFELKNSASMVAIDLDIRADRGQVIAPPSKRKHGQYVVEASAPEEVADAPAWLVELACTEVPTERVGEPVARTDRPGDQWAATVTWAELLTPHGFELVRTDRAGVSYWHVPTASNPTGATTNYAGLDLLRMFSSAFPAVPAETTVSKFGFLVATRFDGDVRAAANWCREQGFGEDEVPVEDLFDPAVLDGTGTPGGANEAEPSSSAEWEDPLPLSPETELPTFPAGVFPDAIEAAIDEVAERLQSPRDLTAFAVLGSAVAVTTGRVEVDLDGQQIEQANLYLTCIAAPSTGKSPASKALGGFLHEAEKEYGEWIAPLLHENKRRQAQAQQAVEEARESGDPAKVKEASEKLTAAEKLQTEPSKLIVGDATPEALEVLLARNGGGATVADTEGAVFGLMAGRYSDSENVETYLRGWSSDAVSVERISRPPVRIERATLSMAIYGQPIVLMELGGRPGFTGRGLIARFMICVPTFRPYWKRDLRRHRVSPEATATMQAYDDLMTTWALNLLKQPFSERSRYVLSEEALHLWSLWHEQAAQRLMPGGDLDGKEAWCSKAADSVVRLAAILQSLYGFGYDEEISAAIMERAITVGDYWFDHQVHVEAMWAAHPSLRVARSILRWATDRNRPWTVREFHRAHQGIVASVDEIQPGVDYLIERGWIRVQPDESKRGPGRPTTTYITHPSARPEDADPVTVAVTAGHPFEPVPEPLERDNEAPPAKLTLVTDDWADRGDQDWPDEDWPDEDPYLSQEIG